MKDTLDDISRAYKAGFITKQEALRQYREAQNQKRDSLIKGEITLNRAEENDKKNGISRPDQESDKEKDKEKDKEQGGVP